MDESDPEPHGARVPVLCVHIPPAARTVLSDASSHRLYSYTFQMRAQRIWLKVMLIGVCGCFAHVVTSRLLPFSMMFRPSSSAPPTPSLLFPHGQRDWSAVSDIFSDLPGAKIAGPAHSDKCEDVSGYLAASFHSTGYEPKQSDKMVLADDDATPINDPDHDSISKVSKTTLDNTGWFGVPAVWESSVSQIDSLTRETEGKQRMRGDRDGSVISVGESLSRRSRRNSTRSHSHKTQREFYSDERDPQEHLERRAQQATCDENSVRRNFYSTEYNMEIQSSERRNSEYTLLESRRELSTPQTTTINGKNTIMQRSGDENSSSSGKLRKKLSRN